MSNGIINEEDNFKRSQYVHWLHKLTHELEYTEKTIICALCVFDKVVSLMDGSDPLLWLVTCFISISKLTEHAVYETRHVLIKVSKCMSYHLSEDLFQTTEVDLFALFDYSFAFHDDIYIQSLASLDKSYGMKDDDSVKCAERIMLSVLVENSSLDPRLDTQTQSIVEMHIVDENEKRLTLSQLCPKLQGFPFQI